MNTRIYKKKYIYINILIIGCYDEYYDVMMVFYFSTLNFILCYTLNIKD